MSILVFHINMVILRSPLFSGTPIYKKFGQTSFSFLTQFIGHFEDFPFNSLTGGQKNPPCFTDFSEAHIF
jgi:hypothetical protein